MRAVEAIVAYLSGETSPEETDRFEAELFEGEYDGDDLTALAGMLVDVRHAALLGMLTLTVSRAEVEQLAALGYRILELRFGPGRLVEGDLSGDFELLLVEYELDLRGVTRLDVDVCDAAGRPFKRIQEVPFQPGQTSVMGYCARETALAAARELPEGTRIRFLSIEEEGERLLCEYHARATRLPP